MRLDKLKKIHKIASDICDCNIVWANEGVFDFEEYDNENWDDDKLNEDLVKIFNKSGIRMFFADDYYSCCVTDSGDLTSVLVYHQSGLEDVGNETYPIVTFSIVTDPACGGRGIARKLITDFCSSNSHSIVKAEVLNPFLYRILESLGFEVESEGETISNKPIKNYVKYPK